MQYRSWFQESQKFRVFQKIHHYEIIARIKQIAYSGLHGHGHLQGMIRHLMLVCIRAVVQVVTWIGLNCA